MTVEANPETVTPALAALLRDGGVNRVSLGAQSFAPHLLATLERVAGPDDVRRAVHTLRDAGFDNISLDLIYGIPGQSAADLERDLAEALALEPEHLSCYELEAKPGTRFTHAHGAGARAPGGGARGLLRARRRDADRRRLPLVRDGQLLPARSGRGRAGSARTAQPGLLARARLPRASASARSRRSHGTRWRNTPSIGRYLAALAAGRRPEREVEELDRRTRQTERVLLGLRLDEPLALAGLDDAVDTDGLERVERLGLAVRGATAAPRRSRSTPRGRLLGGGVTAELVA